MPCQSCPSLSHLFNHVRQEVPFTKLFTVQFIPSHVQYLLSTVFSRSPAGVIIRISYFSRHGLDCQGTFEDSVLVGSSLYASLQFSSFIDGVLIGILSSFDLSFLSHLKSILFTIICYSSNSELFCNIFIASFHLTSANDWLISSNSRSYLCTQLSTVPWWTGGVAPRVLNFDTRWM